MNRMPLRAAAALALSLAACRGLSDEQAVALVRAYNQTVSDAYRSGDVRRLGSVAGPAELKKLAGLIGVKLDMGITLDAQLVDLQLLGLERRKDAVVVETKEEWYYLDRRIGTGERVGQDSTDHYRVRYFLRRPEGRWVVDAIEFAEPPQVGRLESPLRAPGAAFHGMLPAEEAPDSPRAAPDGGAR